METDEMSEQRAEKMPCKDDLIDIPSDDNQMFDIPVLESPAEPAIDDSSWSQVWILCQATWSSKLIKKTWLPRMAKKRNV